ncbi:MAG: tyrosine-type recombinase/integrase [Bryobacteraceae bacterium]|jgi:site-specific recombinase XerD
MTRQPKDGLLALVQSFFQDYLHGIRGASNHTIRAYRDALKLFFLFLASRERRSVAELSLNDVRAESVLGFLDHVESQRGNSAASRNCRLAALRSFVQHLLRHDIARADQYGGILAIASKRAVIRVINYLEPEEARAVIAAVDAQTPHAARDLALLLLLYNTGARVSEALAVHPRELRLDRPRQVRLHGKGGKERVCPLWPETAAALREIVSANAPDKPIFQNARGAPLTRDGVAYLLDKYVRRASETRPDLRTRRVTPHVMRHSCAVALLQAGVDVSVIRDYLGHASVATTSRYITTNLKMKRDVLEAFWKRSGLTERTRRRWSPSPKLLAFLEKL